MIEQRSAFGGGQRALQRFAEIGFVIAVQTIGNGDCFAFGYQRQLFQGLVVRHILVKRGPDRIEVPVLRQAPMRDFFDSEMILAERDGFIGFGILHIDAECPPEQRDIKPVKARNRPEAEHDKRNGGNQSRKGDKADHQPDAFRRQ